MNTNDKNPMQDLRDLDGLLSSFFKAELPDPFPPFKQHAAQMPMPVATPRDVRRFEVSKSRLSLAASVALIIGGCWYLSNQIGTPVNRTNMGKGDGSAKITEPLKAKTVEEVKKPMMP